MTLVDTSTEFGKRVQQRLDDERIIWLITTGNKSGTPQPNPVWFLRHENDQLVVYTPENTPKLRNISSHPEVTLNFNSTPEGGDVVIFQGKARVDAGTPAVKDDPAYLEKYGDGIASIGMTPESFSSQYSVAVRVQLTRVRGE